MATERGDSEAILALQRAGQARALESVGLAASGLVHDIANPLQIVMSMAEMLLLRTDDPEHVREHAQAIAEAAALMQRVTRRFLEYARPAPARATLARLTEVIDGALPLLRAIARQRGTRLETRYGDESLCARIRSREVQQVLVTLVTLAAESVAQPGGGRPEPLVLSLERAARGVRITITDRGPGMSRERVAQLFEANVETLTATDERTLERLVCRQIAEEHGGSIWAESELGVGTRIHLELPPPEA